MSHSTLIHRWVLVLAAATMVGCGSGNENTTSTGSSDSTQTSLAKEGAPPSNSPSMQDAAQAESAQVVSQFLDRIRRGGGDHRADELLTTTARGEINRVGGVQTIGAPDSKFVVTRSQPAPAEDGTFMKDAMLVHSVWSEAGSEAGVDATETQVVWAVQREFDQWRISGMAIELVPGQAPTIIDFENRNQMTQLFGQMAPATSGQSDAPQQASLPSQVQSR